MSAADVLAEHHWTHVVHGCRKCDFTTTIPRFVQHQLDALKAAGYVVIELPKPDPDTGPYFDAGNGAIAHADGEQVRLHSFAWTEGRQGGAWFTPAQARSTAAALLAASLACEVSNV